MSAVKQMSMKKTTLVDVAASPSTTADGTESSVPSSWSDVQSLRAQKDAGSDAGSDMETQTTTERSSKSRPFSQRSSGTKKKKLAKFQAYLAAKKAENGEVMTAWHVESSFQMTEDQREANAAAALVTTPLSHSLPGSSSDAVRVPLSKDTPSAIYKDIVEAAAETRVDVFSRLFLGCDEDYDARKAIVGCDLRSVEKRVTHGDKCLVCDKYISAGHLESIQHKKAISWHASCDALMGVTPQARQYATGLRLKSDCILSEESLKVFWGGPGRVQFGERRNQYLA